MPLPVQPPAPPEKIASNEDLYLAGLRLEQFHSPAAEPEPYYQEALRRDPGDVRANTRPGHPVLQARPVRAGGGSGCGQPWSG